MGSSLAGALKEADPTLHIFGADTSAGALQEARALGLFEAADAPGFDKIDLVVLACPLEAFAQWFTTLSKEGYAGIITDVASAKLPVMQAATSHLKDPSMFIPGHPMAGREKSGVGAAQSDLFKDACWILTPSSEQHTNVHAYQRIHSLLTTLGARVITLEAEQHDELMATVSHVPHVAASALALLAYSHSGKAELLRLAGTGFKDTTRVASGDPNLWAGILTSNANLIVRELRELRSILTDFEHSLTEKDESQLRSLLKTATEARAAILATWAPESAALIEVQVNMGNAPGAIAQITAEAARRGCNIQAIDIDHQTEQHAILRLTLTDEGDIKGFVSCVSK
jgi:prephenate dehydrogenase